MIIGHRGSKWDVMENTLESILYAIDLGVDGIEFDVQKCCSGEIVIFHDETFDRLALKDDFYVKNIRGKKIYDLTWKDITKINLIDEIGQSYKIPKLIDVLRSPKVYNSNVLINIEIKDLISHQDVGY